MRDKKYSWFYGVLAGLITLVLLFTAQALFNKYAMAKPVDKMLEQIAEIESFKVTFDERGATERGKIELTLTRVKNLQTLYAQILAGLDKYGGAQKYDIVLKDKRNAQLEDFYYQIHYFLEEARNTGNFSLMAEKIQKKSAEAAIRSKIYVDDKYIYLQAEYGAENMYIVLPRGG